MKKKIFTAMLCAAMVLTSSAGCGNVSAESEVLEGTTDSDEEIVEETADSDEFDTEGVIESSDDAEDMNDIDVDEAQESLEAMKELSAQETEEEMQSDAIGEALLYSVEIYYGNSLFQTDYYYCLEDDRISQVKTIFANEEYWYEMFVKFYDYDEGGSLCRYELVAAGDVTGDERKFGGNGWTFENEHSSDGRLLSSEVSYYNLEETPTGDADVTAFSRDEILSALGDEDGFVLCEAFFEYNKDGAIESVLMALSEETANDFVEAYGSDSLDIAFEYDNNGYVTKLSFQIGELSAELDYEYDEDGNRIFMLLDYGDMKNGLLYSFLEPLCFLVDEISDEDLSDILYYGGSIVREYNEYGNVTCKVLTQEDETEEYDFEYVYDDESRIIESMKYSDGELVEKMCYSWGNEQASDSTEQSLLKDSMESAKENQRRIAAGDTYVVGILNNGTVAAAGKEESTELEVESWTDIVSVAASEYVTFGIKSDGTMTASGMRYYEGEGFYGEYYTSVKDWTDITDMDIFENQLFALKTDGTVLLCTPDAGWYEDVTWTGIEEIAIGSKHIVGLKADGTVISDFYSNPNNFSQRGQTDVEEWTDIVSITASAYTTFGLKSDGTVVCTEEVDSDEEGVFSDINSWANIVAIAASDGADEYLVGLESDGTVLIAGNEDDIENLLQIINEWTDIVAIDACGTNIIGMTSDGMILSTSSYLSQYTLDLTASSWEAE